MPVHQKDDSREKLNALMPKEQFAPTESPYRAPAMLVLKKLADYD